jgi:hypothetical protein
MSKVDAVVEKYIQLRDKVKALKEQHKEELKPYVDGMTKLEGHMLGMMQAQGVQNMKTKHGTAYISTTTKPKVENWIDFFEYATSHGYGELIEHRASKSAVDEFLEDKGELPPGISITTEINCRFKR